MITAENNRPIIVEETLSIDGKWVIRAMSISPEMIAGVKANYPGAKLMLKQRFSDGTVVRRDARTGEAI